MPTISVRNYENICQPWTELINKKVASLDESLLYTTILTVGLCGRTGHILGQSMQEKALSRKLKAPNDAYNVNYSINK